MLLSHLRHHQATDVALVQIHLTSAMLNHVGL